MAPAIDRTAKDEPAWWKDYAVPADISESMMVPYDGPKSIWGAFVCLIKGHAKKVYQGVYQGGYSGEPHGLARGKKTYFIKSDNCFCTRCHQMWLLNWRDSED